VPIAKGAVAPVAQRQSVRLAAKSLGNFVDSTGQAIRRQSPAELLARLHVTVIYV
jgi:hypothetical protein